MAQSLIPWAGPHLWHYSSLQNRFPLLCVHAQFKTAALGMRLYQNWHSTCRRSRQVPWNLHLLKCSYLLRLSTSHYVIYATIAQHCERTYGSSDEKSDCFQSKEHSRNILKPI